MVPAPVLVGRGGGAMIAPLRRLRSGLDRLGRLKKRTPGAAAAPGRTGSEGGRLYALWLWALPPLLGLALGWLAAACIGVALDRSVGMSPSGPEAPGSVSGRTAGQAGLMDGFLAANPFRISPLVPVSEPEAKSADVVVTGSLATAVLRGTLPRAGAWLEDKGVLKLVLLNTSFDVYTLKWVTYREAVFVKGEERVVKALNYGEPGRPAAAAARAPDAPAANVPGLSDSFFKLICSCIALADSQLSAKKYI